MSNAPIVPTSIVPNVNPGTVQPTPAPIFKPTVPVVPIAPCESVAPIVSTPHIFDIGDYLLSLDVNGATALGKTLSTLASDDVITAIYAGLAGRLKEIRSARESAKSNVA